MSLQEFIKQIPSIILERGRDYFENGSVLNLSENGTTWKAIVEGNYGNYRVRLTMEHNEEVRDHQCNCPYDGTICKHVAAVALAIQENKRQEQVSIKGQHLVTTDSWKQLINKAKIKDLRAFIISYGEEQTDFQHQVYLHFGEAKKDHQTNTAYYRTQVNGIFEQYDYRGYIDYRSSHMAMKDVDDFLQKMDRYYVRKEFGEAFSIAAAIAEEGSKAIQNMDDSSGECSGAIYESFEMVENILKSDVSSNFKDEVFDWLYEQVQNPDYEDYGMGDKPRDIFFEMANILKRQNKAYQFLDEKISQLQKTEEGWSENYYTELYLNQKITLLGSEKKHLEAEQLIDENLKFHKIRKLKVEQLLSQNEWKEAEQLIQEGVDIACQEKHPGITHNWKDQLLDLYERYNQPQKYRKLVRELFIENTTDIQYFKQYKKCTPKEHWVEKRNELIAEIKKLKSGNYHHILLDDFASIYIEEQMIDDLFRLVSSSNSIQIIIKYTDHLKKDYPDELLEYYKAAIEIAAEQIGRNVYISLVGYLKKMASIKGGLPKAKQLMEALVEKYKKRSAMKEEFKKLGWN